jgi:hypothetical protein
VLERHDEDGGEGDDGGQGRDDGAVVEPPLGAVALGAAG